MGKVEVNASRRLWSIVGLTVALVALLGAQGEAAEAAPLHPRIEIAASKHQPSSARPGRPRRATLGGHTDYSGASVVLHYSDGYTWQPYLQIYADQSGFYSLRVPVGWRYAFYVSAEVTTTIPLPNGGLIPCIQTWDDWSVAVTPRRGRVYSYLHTYLQPAQPGCDLL